MNKFEQVSGHGNKMLLAGGLAGGRGVLQSNVFNVYKDTKKIVTSGCPLQLNF